MTRDDQIVSIREIHHSGIHDPVNGIRDPFNSHSAKTPLMMCRAPPTSLLFLGLVAPVLLLLLAPLPVESNPAICLAAAPSYVGNNPAIPSPGYWAELNSTGINSSGRTPADM